MTSVLRNYNNLTQRIIAAVIGAFIIIFGTAYSQWSYFAVFFIICMLAQLEFYTLTGLAGRIPLKTFGTITGLLLFTLSFLIEAGVIGSKFYFLIFPVTAGIFLIKLYKKQDHKPFANIAFTFLGIIFIALPFVLLNISSYSQGHYSYEIILGCLLIIWASDTGAYFAGRRFGKRKLFERVSPKKSWEGSVGGALLAAIMGLTISFYFHDLPQWKWITISGIIIVAGTYGDLVESLFKRSIKVKDSGSVIPGHGGFLDRFDSLLLSTPFLVTFLKIF
ncbi:MAG: phosphatidate cytidylyltransferase [Bacteroidota bacterium]